MAGLGFSGVKKPQQWGMGYGTDPNGSPAPHGQGPNVSPTTPINGVPYPAPAPIPHYGPAPNADPNAAWMGNYLKDLQGKINQPRTQPQPYSGPPVSYDDPNTPQPGPGIVGPNRGIISALPAPIPHGGPNRGVLKAPGVMFDQQYTAPTPGTVMKAPAGAMSNTGVEVDAGGNPIGPGPHGQGPDPNTLPRGDDPNNFFSQGNVTRSLRNLGFGEAPRPFDPAQGGFSDFDAMERAAYQSQFAPVQREIERQRVRGTEQMRARLAQMGISDSGVGLAQETMQNQDVDQRLASASAEAASRAAGLRYGADLQQSMGNAQLRQQTNQLNAEQQQRAQASFLSLLGLNQQDLARLDQQQLENLRLMYDTYLKQLAIIGQIGTASFGKGDGSSTSLGVQVGAGLF